MSQSLENIKGLGVGHVFLCGLSFLKHLSWVCYINGTRIEKTNLFFEWALNLQLYLAPWCSVNIC